MLVEQLDQFGEVGKSRAAPRLSPAPKRRPPPEGYYKADVTAMSRKDPADMMSAGAGFHRHDARRKLRRQTDQPLALKPQCGRERSSTRRKKGTFFLICAPPK
jgi:hypothetical protein